MPDFGTLIKPASSLCNMRCKYCFYADECAVRSVRSFGIMTKDTAHRLIDRAYEFTDNGRVMFAFQGGEPLVAGHAFFEDFTGYALSKKPEKVTLSFSLQTNGTLIDGRFCDLFARHGFLVGLSVDGPESMNDMCRVDADGNGTFKRAMDAAGLLKKHHVDFNVLSVVTRYTANHPRQLWNFYKRNGFDFVQLIPCLAPLEDNGSLSDHNLAPSDYSRFLQAFFRLWADDLKNGKYISVRLFDNLVRMAMGKYPEMCGMLGSCSAQFVIEADGGVYPCDFYAVDKYLAGNIYENSFREILVSYAMKGFLYGDLQKPPACVSCDFFRICRGGCKRYRGFYLHGSAKCPYAEFLRATHQDIAEIAERIRKQNFDREDI